MKTVENYTNREWYYRVDNTIARVFTTGCMPVAETPGETMDKPEIMVVVKNFSSSQNSVLIPLEKFRERCLCPVTLFPGDLVARVNHGSVIQVYRVAEEERSGAAPSLVVEYVLIPLNFGDLTPTGAPPVKKVGAVVSADNIITVAGETKTVMGSYFCYLNVYQLGMLKYDAQRENIRRTAVKISDLINTNNWCQYTAQQSAALDDVEALIKSATKIIHKIDGEEER